MILCAIIDDEALLFGSDTLGAAQNYSTGFSLAICGFIMMILFVAGILPKIDAFGGFGATIPLFGLVGAVAGSTLGYKAETKSSFIKSFFKATWPLKRFLLIAFGITVAYSLMVNLAFKPDLTFVHEVPYLDPTNPANGPLLGAGAEAGLAPISLLFSFIFTGCLAVIGQIVMFIVKPKGMQDVLNILLGGYIVGCVLSSLGILPYLFVYGPGGITAPVTGAGEFVYTTITFGTNLGGVIPPMWTTVLVRLVTFCLVITIQFVWGIIAGLIASAKGPAPAPAR
jgi:hypothetical protein